TPEDAHIILYTSGSTGVPKGVELRHSNIVSFIASAIKAYEITSEDNWAAYASFGFDVSMGDLWVTLAAGATLVVVPDELRLDLHKLNEFFEQNNVTGTLLTTQVGKQFVDTTDNKSLKVLAVGGEKLVPTKPPKYRLLNIYGPTEATVWVTSFEVDKYYDNVPIGKPAQDLDLYIINENGGLCEIGEVGEINIAGRQVGYGYLNNPEKTEAAFKNNPFRPTDSDYSRMYKTGDLAKYLPDGNIEILGRTDFQIKIRGFRVELSEIENRIREYDNILDATVVPMETPTGGKNAVAYIVVPNKNDFSISNLNDFIKDKLPDYMVPSATVLIDEIPLTQNGKVDRKSLPQPDYAPINEPTQATQANSYFYEKIRKSIEATLGHPNFTADLDLFTVGLTSLGVMKIQQDIDSTFGVSPDVTDILADATAENIEKLLTEKIIENATSSSTPLSKIDTTSAELSSSQKGIYFESIKTEENMLYNIPVYLGFPGAISSEKLQSAIETVFKLHPSFNIKIDVIDNKIIQSISDDAIKIENLGSISSQEFDNIKANFVRPFNINRDSLYRFTLATVDGQVRFLFDIHHIIFDGVSLDLFINEILQYLKYGNVTATESISLIQNANLESTDKYSSSDAIKYYEQEFSDFENASRIEQDIHTNTDESNQKQIDAKINTYALRSFCSANGITDSSVLLSAVSHAISIWTHSKSVYFSTISSGRENAKLANTIGMFVQTLPIKIDIESKSIIDFAKSAATKLNEGITHKNYPYVEFVNKFNYDSSIVFASELGVLNQYEIDGQPIINETLKAEKLGFDIAILAMENTDGVYFTIQYNGNHYSDQIMQGFIQTLQTVTNKYITSPAEKNITEISGVSDSNAAILESFQAKQTPKNNQLTLIDMFKNSVLYNGNNNAIIYNDITLSYNDVDRISDNIAAKLESMGIKRGDGVAVMGAKCELIFLAALAAVKIGAFYQPLDPGYPTDRLEFMLEDSDAKAIIIDEDLKGRVPNFITKASENIILTKDIYNLPETLHPYNPASKPETDDAHIILYTSGSTGNPKGVKLRHSNMVASANSTIRNFKLSHDDNYANYASFGFDASMADFWWSMCSGATLVIVPDDIRLDLEKLNEYYEQNNVTTGLMTTQIGRQFAETINNKSLRLLFVGGEKLVPFKQPNFTVVNLYGPTENTVYVTSKSITEQTDVITVGKPADNINVYVLDVNDQIAPTLAPGEICIAGEQVGYGYLNNPEKTEAVFIHNQFTDNPDYARLYRTGDLGRFLENGDLDVMGRTDFQVKIRGFRVELTEIENRIREFDNVVDAAVVALDAPAGGKAAVAYIVTDADAFSIPALNEFILEKLPSYMVPSASMILDEIPVNQNGKVDRKQLPAPDYSRSTGDIIAAKNEVEQKYIDVFKSVLKLDTVSATDSFFNIGGSSISATRLLVAIENAGLTKSDGSRIVYADIFQNPSPAALALLSDEDAKIAVDSVVEDYDYTNIDKLLQAQDVKSAINPELFEYKSVLLSGATGFLGAHILKELIDDGKTVVHCLVRKGSFQSSELRLKTMLYYYFENSFDELFGKRIFAIDTDITDDSLVINLSNLDLDLVINTAANVSHFASDDSISRVNVTGAKNIADLAMSLNARLIQVSTGSVAGLSPTDKTLNDPVLTDKKLYFGQSLDNQYAHSKFLAERYVLENIVNDNLDAKIMRLGNLMGRNVDGEFQINFKSNSFVGSLKGYAVLGEYPISEYRTKTTLTPIDLTAKAILKLSVLPSDLVVFTPDTIYDYYMGDIMKIMQSSGINIKFVEDDEFRKNLQQAFKDPNKTEHLTAMIAYDAGSTDNPIVWLDYDNSFTSQVLLRQNWNWERTSSEYIKSMIEYLNGLGYF
ncbi:MAG: amino acid adenylation domain-containing protein, partial [Bifidobacteriaceae bacterium]|nr:amino acid adenylation domain-containing protein [Bifidobacteriaceae bacterium]